MESPREGREERRIEGGRGVGLGCPPHCGWGFGRGLRKMF